MSTLEEEIRATEQAVAGSANALAEFWERSAAELWLDEEYVPEPITGTTAGPILDYIPSAILRKPTRPSLVKATPRPTVAEARGSTPAVARRNLDEERQRLKEVRAGQEQGARDQARGEVGLGTAAHSHSEAAVRGNAYLATAPFSAPEENRRPMYVSTGRGAAGTADRHTGTRYLKTGQV